MRPALASRNRCDSFRAIFLTGSVAADGADGQAGASWRNRRNSGVRQFWHYLVRIERDRRADAGSRGRIERAAGGALLYGVDLSAFGAAHDGLLWLRLPAPRDPGFHRR